MPTASFAISCYLLFITYMQGGAGNKTEWPEIGIFRHGRMRYPDTPIVIRKDYTRKEGETSIAASWEEWWTYDGISGPDFWGLLNPKWGMCSKGRRQSPIDLKPTLLLFDPNLRPMQIDKQRVNGMISNTGHSVLFKVDSSQSYSVVNISGGPLSYSYRFDEIHLHYGRSDTYGSEHIIGGYSFPLEIQIYGYNHDLYGNATEAVGGSQGLVGISLLTQIGEVSNIELRLLTSQLNQIRFKGQRALLKSLSIRQLIPETDYYMTYEGSITMPGCQESVTWIIINKPLYITKQQLYALRKLMQGDQENPKAPLGNNFRPPQPLYHRTVRTNIDFKRAVGRLCPTMNKNMNYEGKIPDQATAEQDVVVHYSIAWRVICCIVYPSSPFELADGVHALSLKAMVFSKSGYSQYTLNKMAGQILVSEWRLPHASGSDDHSAIKCPEIFFLPHLLDCYSDELYKVRRHPSNTSRRAYYYSVFRSNHTLIAPTQQTSPIQLLMRLTYVTGCHNFNGSRLKRLPWTTNSCRLMAGEAIEEICFPADDYCTSPKEMKTINSRKYYNFTMHPSFPIPIPEN